MHTSSLYDESTLLTLVAEGDIIAFRELFERHRKKVLFVAKKLLGSGEEAEDVLQEIFTKIWANKEKLPSILQFNAYLNTILRNEVFNMLRKKAYGAAFMEEMQKESRYTIPFNTPAELYELQQRLSDAIRQLPPQQQKVFQLGRLEGYKHEEIARMMRISKGTVKKHMAEALRNIRTILGDAGNAATIVTAILMLY